ncbi:hypothetical protein BCV70DRAFT_197016 [Testicularia cyperi]|uniref:Uncharacterized protein n=1 Tax=Testicularia cyperi TaxID=1882483 RepID=A0A317XXW5_9BASI|nr:hypothetical protein BCV70DRAFT_197016 [Testicularia cyperi]
MSKRSRSDSSSSDASSSSSGSSVEATTPSSSSARLPGSKNLSGIGYKPPRGFKPVDFSKSTSLTETRLNSFKGHEVWALRIPAGVTPSQLDGLVLQVPQKLEGHDASKPLATFTAPTSSATLVNTYNLYASTPDVKRKTAKKSAASSGADSQLIAMAAAGSLNPANPKKNVGLDGNAGIAVGESGAAELESLRLLVPSGDGSQAGKLVVAPVKIAKCMHLSIASPASSGIATTPAKAEVVTPKKGKRQQPWELLTGNFKPAGSRTDVGDTANGTETAQILVAEAKVEAASPVKSEKGDKKRKDKKESDKDDKKSKKSKKA